MFRSWKEFIVWENSTKDTIDVKKSYIDIVGDLLAGILLSQIVYWYLPDKEGRTKLRVKKEGHYWIAKKREEWYEEIRFTEANYKTAIKKLEKAKLVVKEVFKFDGAPTTHIRLNIPVFLTKLNDLLKKHESNLKQDEFDDFNTYLINEMTDKPLSHMDSVESTEWKRLNQPNGNGRINRMETVESTESLTKNTTENTTEITYKDSLSLDLPLEVKSYIESKSFKKREREIEGLQVSDVVKRYDVLKEKVSISEFVATLDHIVLNFDEIKTFSSLFQTVLEKNVRSSDSKKSKVDKISISAKERRRNLMLGKTEDEDNTFNQTPEITPEEERAARKKRMFELLESSTERENK